MNIFKSLISKIKGTTTKTTSSGEGPQTSTETETGGSLLSIVSRIISKIFPKKPPEKPAPVPDPPWDWVIDRLANEKIEELIEKIKEMDSEGYAPEFSHTWSMSPKKAPNSNGAGIAKETSGNKIIDLIRDEVRINGATAVAKSIEAHWDEIIYMIERLEFAIYDAQYRKKAGGRGAYEAGLLRLRQILTSEAA